MKIGNIKKEKRYTRKFERIGEELVLLKVMTDEKYMGQNFHYFFTDKRKPPLDIAVNPDDGTIEYVSCFIQNEKVTKRTLDINIKYMDNRIMIEIEEFDQKTLDLSCFCCTLEGKFEVINSRDDIFVLKNVFVQKVQAFSIDDKNYLLFAGNEFIGVLFKSILDKEMEELISSNVI